MASSPWQQTAESSCTVDSTLGACPTLRQAGHLQHTQQAHERSDSTDQSRCFLRSAPDSYEPPRIQSQSTSTLTCSPSAASTLRHPIDLTASASIRSSARGCRILDRCDAMRSLMSGEQNAVMRRTSHKVGRRWVVQTSQATCDACGAIDPTMHQGRADAPLPQGWTSESVDTRNGESTKCIYRCQRCSSRDREAGSRNQSAAAHIADHEDG